MTAGHQTVILREELGAGFMNSMVRMPLLSRERNPGTGKGTAEQSVQSRQISILPPHHLTVFQMIINTHVLLPIRAIGNWNQRHKLRAEWARVRWGGGWTSQSKHPRKQREKERKNKKGLQEQALS